MEIVQPSGGKSQLPKTGQTTSYTDWDDGDLQQGNPITPRFVDNGDNTVTDKATSLMWIQRPELIIPDGLNANNIGVERGDWVSATSYLAGDIITDSSNNKAYICLIANNHTAVDFATELATNPTYWLESIWATKRSFEPFVDPKTMTWQNAVDNCSALVALVKSDWVLPNVFELASILNLENYNPCTYTTYFLNCPNSEYFSSTTDKADTEAKWTVNFGTGAISPSMSGGAYVRPVREI